METESEPTIVNPEPGEIILRAEPVSDAKPPTIQYNRPRPRPILYLPDLIPWRQVWTAVRILALLALVGFLVAVLQPYDRGYSHPRSRTRSYLRMLETALQNFKRDVGRPPTQTEGLGALVQPPPGIAKWRGPYLKTIPDDGWRHAYRYAVPGIYNTGGLDLSSDGQDGKLGTADDITNW